LSETHYYYISPAGKLAGCASADDALAAARQGGFAWLDYIQPGSAELSDLIEPLGIHPLSIEDCLDDNQIPKIEDYLSNTFLIFNAFNYVDRKLTIHEVDLFIGENFLVSVSGRGPGGWRPLEDIPHIVEMDPESVIQGPAFLLYVILDKVVDQKFDSIEVLEEQLDDAEESMLADIASYTPAELLHLRRELITLRKCLFHEREILVKICRKDCPFIPEKAIFHYRDIYDHLANYFELTEAAREIVTTLMEIYLTMVNNQMTRAANQMNSSVRRLTFITTIFMPLTLLAGIGGMSEWSMMTGSHNWRIAYPLFLVAMVLLGVVSYFLLRWLERRGADG
jgi:magnesium transporter